MKRGVWHQKITYILRGQTMKTFKSKQNNCKIYIKECAQWASGGIGGWSGLWKPVSACGIIPSRLRFMFAQSGFYGRFTFQHIFSDRIKAIAKFFNWCSRALIIWIKNFRKMCSRGRVNYATTRHRSARIWFSAKEGNLKLDRQMLILWNTEVHHHQPDIHIPGRSHVNVHVDCKLCSANLRMQ